MKFKCFLVTVFALFFSVAFAQQYTVGNNTYLGSPPVQGNSTYLDNPPIQGNSTYLSNPPNVQPYGIVDENCTVTIKGKTILLKGRVRVVTSGADLKVQAVSSGYDIVVKIQEGSAYSCGDWVFVENNTYDFTIQFVEHNPDIKIAKSHWH